MNRLTGKIFFSALGAVCCAACLCAQEIRLNKPSITYTRYKLSKGNLSDKTEKNWTKGYPDKGKHLMLDKAAVLEINSPMPLIWSMAVGTTTVSEKRPGGKTVLNIKDGADIQLGGALGVGNNSLFEPGSQLIVDGAKYAGGPQIIPLIEAVKVDEKGVQTQIRGFPPTLKAKVQIIPAGRRAGVYLKIEKK